MSHALLLRRSLLIAGLALTLAQCRDSFEPGLTARLAVAPILPSRAELAAFGLTIDGVRFVVVRPSSSDTLADTTVVVPLGATELVLDLRVPLLRNPDSVEVSILVLSGTTPLFSGTQLVPVPTPLPPPQIAVNTYVGPAVDSVVVVPNAPFILLNDSLQFQVLGFNGGAPVSQIFVAWSTSDTALARVDARGMLRAPGTRSNVRVRARTPSGAADSVLATFTPVATQLLSIAGGGQTDTVGNALAVPLEVEARAADGLGVGGVTVRFRALGGGAVADSLVVTDAAGRARTLATLGGAIGLQTFEATASGIAGSPITFSATALAGPPTQLGVSVGDAQLAVVGSAVGVAPAVVVRDAGGNPVQGVAVTFAVIGGGGSVTGASQVTGANGIATVGSWTLGTGAGANTLRADAGPLSRSFTATAIAGPPTQLVVAAGNLQSALVGTAVAVDPAARLQDQYGNPIAGATVAFAVSGGGGSVTGATQLTNAAGIATVGSWGLGTAVGTNTLTASLSGGGVTPVAFSATALAGTATAILKLAGDLQTGIVNTLLGTAPRVKLVDQFGNPVAGANVTFAVGAGGGGVSGATQTTDTAGHATVGGWTLGTAVGTNELRASAGSLSTTFSAGALPGVASQITGVAGNNQSALVNTILPVAPAAIVRDQFNNPVPGVSVTFTPSAGGAVTGGTATSDSAGIAAVGSWELDSIAGVNTLTATAGSLTTQFSATGLAGAIAQLAKTAGDGLSAVVGTAVATPPTVRARDQYGNPVAGASVLFSVTAGNGRISGATATTNANGFAAAGAWTLDTIVGANQVTASAGGQSAVFGATGLVGAPSRLLEVAGDSQTVVVNRAVPTTPAVRLTDRYGNPIVGATVFFDIRVDGGSVTDSLPVTDATGLATPGSWVVTTFVATNLLDASVAGIPAVRFTAFTLPDVPTQLLRASPDTQTALAGQAVGAPPVIEVRDTFFNPVPGVTVDFRLTGALIGSVTPLSTTTDAQGVARVTTWTLASAVGPNTLEVTSPAVTADTIVFNANGITTTATSVSKLGGDLQSGVVAQALATPYTVRVLDAGGAPVQGVQVRWSAGQGGVMSPVTSLSDISGIASSTHILGQTAGSQSATATVGQLTGSPVTFTATALPDTAFQILAVAGDRQSAAAGTPVGTAPAVQVTDAFGNAIAGANVTFTPAAGSVTGGTQLTDDTGVATVGSWRLGPIVGADSLTVTAGSLAPVVFNATITPGAASGIALLDGDAQTGSVGQALAAPYRVTVTDAFGNAVPEVTVNWAIGARAGGGIFPSSVLTDNAGVAAATHTLGTAAGSYTAFATVSGLADTVTFTSTAIAGAAAAIAKDGGDAQSATVNTLVAVAPTVKVTDQFGAPVAGHSVTWSVVSGGGSLGGASPSTTTDSAGIAAAPPWTLGTAAGGNGLNATAAGLTGSPVLFTATGVAGAPTQMSVNAGNGQSATVGTAVPIKPAVIVKDQFNNAVPAIGVTFTVLSGGGSVVGGNATTNAQGIATVSSWTLGTVAGTNSLQASASGLQPQTLVATATAGAASRVGFVGQPVRALAGDTLEGVNLAIQDAFGNIVFGTQVDVTVGLGALGNPAAKLVGTTVVTTVNGIAMFGDLAIDSAGTGFTLVAGAIAAPLSGDETLPFEVGGVIGAVQADRLGPVDAAFDKSTGFAYIPGATGNALALFDPGKGTLTNVAPIPSKPFAVAVNSLTQRIYVTTLEGLAVFDGRDNTLITVVQVGMNPRGVAVDEEGDRVFVAVLGDSLKGDLPYVVPIDGKDLVPGAPISFPEGSAGAAGLAFNPSDRLLYVAVPNGGLTVIDPAQRAQVAFIAILGKEGAAGTYGVAVDAIANLVYASNRTEGTLSVIDPGKFAEVLRLGVGRLPEAVAVDADLTRHAVYVANTGDGTVSFMDTEKFAVLATLLVGPTPKGIAVDPGAGRFYVPTAADDKVRVVQP